MVIAVLAVILVGVSAYAFRDSLALARAKLAAGAAGGETVSVFDVQVDRENRQYVDILFDRPLGEGLQGQVLEAAPATLYPELSGAWKWQDTNALRFQPNGSFPVASTYTITLIPERILRPRHGARAAPAAPRSRPGRARPQDWIKSRTDTAPPSTT